MGEKGMESPAPSRPGVAGAAETAGRIAGVTGMAGTAAGGSVIGAVPQGAGAGLGEQLQRSAEQSSTVIGQPPKG